MGYKTATEHQWYADVMYAKGLAADPRLLTGGLVNVARWFPSKKQGKRRINKKGKANG